jgi:hypothetical protein
VSDDEGEYDVSVLSSGMTQEGGKLLQQVLGSKVFAYPKPLSLVRSLLRATTRREDIVLDSFAGTGTTGHAVLDLNSKDKGHRRFVLVEMEADICRTITAERLMRAVKGYEYDKPKGGRARAEGLGGGFRYCKLGEPLFDERGNIRESVRFPELAAHVFFTETGAPIPKRATGKTPLLGVHNGKAVYRLFNGVMGDQRPDGGNVLTSRTLSELPSPSPALEGRGVRVIYGEGCRLGPARLKREGVVFRQIPYEIKVT